MSAQHRFVSHSPEWIANILFTVDAYFPLNTPVIEQNPKYCKKSIHSLFYYYTQFFWYGVFPSLFAYMHVPKGLYLWNIIK